MAGNGVKFRRFVAIGDSQTEGVGDPTGPGGLERGWADRFAERLAARQARLPVIGEPTGEAEQPPDDRLLYANLAVRGKLIAQIDEDQIESALAMEPDLISLIGGLNDVLRPGCDVDLVLARMDTMQGRVAASEATILTVTYPDPALMMPLGRLLSETVAEFNRGLRRIAERHGSLLLDVEASARVASPANWCDDRLHLNSVGHQVLADGMFSLIEPRPEGEPRSEGEWWAREVPVAGRTGLPARVAAEVRWAGAFFAPWVYRRLTGKSSGDGRMAKRPELTPVEAGAAPHSGAARISGTGDGNPTHRPGSSTPA